MKKLSLLPIFVLAMVILFSCDKGGNPAELAARQSAMVDSIASAQISTKRQELLATCEQNVQTAIKAKYDSLVAAMPAAKKPTTKVATPPVKKPTPPTTKPTPTPPPPAPPVKDQKGRGGATTKPGENVEDQKERNGAVKVNETTGKVETNVQEQKKRGGATKVNP
ncbi:MAG: hypothetical protein JNM36_04550 [Chitinophagales bacterium]|nr:hypothetical protein [Chitinophagales bacterium]